MVFRSYRSGFTQHEKELHINLKYDGERSLLHGHVHRNDRCHQRRIVCKTARLYAFMQENRNFQTDIFMWRKSEPVQPSASARRPMPARSVSCRKKELVRETVRFSEITKRQLVSYYYVCHTGHALPLNPKVRSLSHSTFSVYMEIARCGKESWAVRPPQPCKKLRLSMRTITRAVRSWRPRFYQHEVGKPSPYLRQSGPDLQPVPPLLRGSCARRMRFMVCFLYILGTFTRATASPASFPDYPPRQI